MPHSIKPESPLDPVTAEILGLVQEGAADAGIACMVVGATARDILLTHVYGLAPARMTYDVDFAVAVGNWEQFEQMKSLLLARKCFDSDDRMKQRLYFVGQDRQRSHPLDLVPFGEIAQDGNQIAWPPDLKVIMNVAGYEEVLNSAEEVQVTPGLIVKVASLAGLAILKLIARSDRGRSNPKDVQDLFHIMTNYAEAGNNDRLYDEELMILESASYDPELAGSRLLSAQAIAVNIEIMRAFVRLREIIVTNKEVAQRLDELENTADRLYSSLPFKGRAGVGMGSSSIITEIKLRRLAPQPFLSLWRLGKKLRGVREQLYIWRLRKNLSLPLSCACCFRFAWLLVWRYKADRPFLR